MEDKKQMKVVAALGHSALGYTTTEQRDAVRVTAKSLADLVEAGCQLTITHSNGPQVSMIHKAMTELHRIYIDYSPAPMCVCSAMSQGYAGYDIQNSLKAELLSRGLSTPVSTILTQVSVDPYDEAFYAPAKKIGRYMSKEDADNEIKKGNFVVEEPGKGYLRVVATPKPLEIMELDSIRLLADHGQVVICCGGGGIPVIIQDGALQGASAVIEKDDIAGKLASDLNADVLLILTSVPYVFTDFNEYSAGYGIQRAGTVWSDGYASEDQCRDYVSEQLQKRARHHYHGRSGHGCPGRKVRHADYGMKLISSVCSIK